MNGSPTGFALLPPRRWAERRRTSCACVVFTQARPTSSTSGNACCKGSPDALVDALVNPGLHYRDLRHVTPFAGVLSASERATAYREFRRDEMQR